MKYFLIAVEIRNGDREYGEQFVAPANDYEDAYRKTKKWLLDNYCCDTDEEWNDNQLDLWDQIIQIQWPTEISGNDYLVLQKYLPSVREGVYWYK
jgi:hypothetical protein